MTNSVLPKKLAEWVESQCVFEYYKDGTRKPNSFYDGAEALFSHLLSDEPSFDEQAANCAYQSLDAVDAAWGERSGFMAGARWSNSQTLATIAALKAQNEFLMKLLDEGDKEIHRRVAELHREQNPDVIGALRSERDGLRAENELLKDNFKRFGEDSDELVKKLETENKKLREALTELVGEIDREYGKSHEKLMHPDSYARYVKACQALEGRSDAQQEREDDDLGREFGFQIKGRSE